MAPRDSLLRVEAAIVAAGGTFRAYGTDRYRSLGICHDASSNDSLVIYYHPDTGNVGFKCFAECSTHEEIRDFLGLSKGDLFDEPLESGHDIRAPRLRIVRPPKPEPAIFDPARRGWRPGPLATLRHRAKGADGRKAWVTHPLAAEYLYSDEDWRIVFGVCRCKCKHFTQWRPHLNADGGRAWGINAYDEQTNDLIATVRTVPYRLPQVLDGIRGEQMIWVAEGEKDVNTLFSQGAIATCNSAGAGKWTPKHAAFLKGADVRVCADRDEPGREHAKTVVASLRGIARSIEVVQARFGKDATDHFAGGGHLGNFALVADPKPLILQETT
jgi:hypothetical protein